MPYTHPNRDIDLQLDQHQERARTPYRGRLRVIHADAHRHSGGISTDALDDAVALSAQVIRLSAELDRVRLDRANLRAAMRATLAAHADGEPDPMWYLRDELDAPESLPANSRRPR